MTALQRRLRHTLQGSSSCNACAQLQTELLSAQRLQSTGAQPYLMPGNPQSWPPLRQSILAGQACNAPSKVRLAHLLWPLLEFSASPLTLWVLCRCDPRYSVV